jgi:hypothetical protein
MYTTGHHSMALQMARQKIDEQVRDAENRRIAREVRRENRSARDSEPVRPRHRWIRALVRVRPTAS